MSAVLLVLRVCLEVVVCLVPLVERVCPVPLESPEILVLRVHLGSVVPPAERETQDQLDSQVPVGSLVPLVQMVLRVLPVSQAQCLRLMVS